MSGVCETGVCWGSLRNMALQKSNEGNKQTLNMVNIQKYPEISHDLQGFIHPRWLISSSWCFSPT